MDQVFDRIEDVIFNNLINNEEFARKVLPFIKPEYFEHNHEKVLYTKITDFVLKYHNLPTKEAILIAVHDDKTLSQDDVQSITDQVKFYKLTSKPEMSWLINETEKWCKVAGLRDAIVKCLPFLEKKNIEEYGSMVKIVSDAVAISFDPRIGHDFMMEADMRFDFYHLKEDRIPFDLDYLNKITNGGVPTKSLNVIMAGVGVGKTLAMCHLASSYLLQGKNVLYITLEMSEERIAERIDANVLDLPIQDLTEVPRNTYLRKIDALKLKTTGRLIVKEYPTAAANVLHFKHLVEELKNIKKFTPDVIFIDYLNIAASSRLKLGGATNSYQYVKSVAEELRGLAVELNLPIWSATQVSRTGFNASDFGMEHTSESFGLPATVDLMLALISTDDLKAQNQILIKQLKNRYNDINQNTKFVVGVERSKMRLFDVTEEAQREFLSRGKKDEEKDDVPAFDNSRCGERVSAEKRFGWGKKGKIEFN